MEWSTTSRGAVELHLVGSTHAPPNSVPSKGLGLGPYSGRRWTGQPKYPDKYEASTRTGTLRTCMLAVLLVVILCSKSSFSSTAMGRPLTAGSCGMMRCTSRVMLLCSPMQDLAIASSADSCCLQAHEDGSADGRELTGTRRYHERFTIVKKSASISPEA